MPASGGRHAGIRKTPCRKAVFGRREGFFCNPAQEAGHFVPPCHGKRAEGRLRGETAPKKPTKGIANVRGRDGFRIVFRGRICFTFVRPARKRGESEETRKGFVQ